MIKPYILNLPKPAMPNSERIRKLLFESLFKQKDITKNIFRVLCTSERKLYILEHISFIIIIGKF